MSDDADGFYSQVRRLDQAEAMARDGLALLYDIDESDIDVVLDEIVLEDDAQGRLADEARALRHAADEAATAAAEATSAAARSLVKSGLSVRDAARVLGLSFQRVAQLTGPRSRK